MFGVVEMRSGSGGYVLGNANPEGSPARQLDLGAFEPMEVCVNQASTQVAADGDR